MNPKAGISKQYVRLLILLVLGLFVFSCAPSVKHYVKINQCLQRGDYDSSLKLIEKNKEAYSECDAALYYVEEGIIAHFAGFYEKSNECLAMAESIMDKLYTESVSSNVASFIINDNTIPYRGEDFERVMVNLFMALNYAFMGLREDALVEARKVDNKLNIINSQYDEDEKNVYKEDAFIRFMMGVLYELEGEINDAFISYRNAAEIYRDDYSHHYGINPPPFLIADMLDMAEMLDFREEATKIKRQYPDITFPDLEKRDGLAEVFFVHYNGRGPEKVERSWNVPMPDGYVMKVAYPAFRENNYRISRGEVTLRNPGSNAVFQFPTLLVEDIGKIAITNLENRLNGIKAKAIARATAKYLATKTLSKETEKRHGSLAGSLVKLAGNIASVVTEQADIRHWRLLPDEIRIGRALVPPGDYQGEITFVNSNGNVILARKIELFTVRSGEMKFFTQRTLD